MLSRRQDGNQVYYGIADDSVFEICNTLCDKIKADLDAQRGGMPETLSRKK